MDRLELRVTSPFMGAGPARKSLRPDRLRQAGRSRGRVLAPGQDPGRRAAACEPDTSFLWREVAYYCALADAPGHAGVRAIAADLAAGCEAAALDIERHAARGRAQPRIRPPP